MGRLDAARTAPHRAAVLRAARHLVLEAVEGVADVVRALHALAREVVPTKVYTRLCKANFETRKPLCGLQGLKPGAFQALWVTTAFSLYTGGPTRCACTSDVVVS